MPFTGRLGSSDSRLGNIVLGYGSARRSLFRRNPRVPFYRVEVMAFADTSTFGIGALVAEFENVKNIGWSDYLNDVPQAFFTINQDDPKISLLRSYKGKSHVRIWRNDDLVWTGWMAMEVDANSTDAIFYCYGYLAGLFWMHTGWDQSWTSAKVQTIVSDSWTRAKTILTNSRLGFVSTGTIESPFTTAGGPTEITLPAYGGFYKRLLFVMQEMAAISASDTSQTTLFEITHALSPTFNFWKDRATTISDLKWEWGDRVVQDFSAYEMPIEHRNDILAVGSIPRDALARTEVEDTADMTTSSWGRMQESVFFAWARDDTEVDRVTKLRASKALTDSTATTLVFYPGAETPPGTSASKWRLGDKVRVVIDRGVTNIDADMQIVGVKVLATHGQEYLRTTIQEPI